MFKLPRMYLIATISQLRIIYIMLIMAFNRRAVVFILAEANVLGIG